ncbi:MULTISPECIES: molecular chaperone [unclassified Serratia (in: enterobacteria)]|uniref:fimbrial biogenesis chaperone n=1 Tax=unclassified Serratia (in: enterobacteria) TaxID=2647522 RepID=UPI00046970D7|nr:MULTISPECIES: fimbria/pilus periplasmic chaperone [unclassified Serratia (in: enterobacteria)]
MNHRAICHRAAAFLITFILTAPAVAGIVITGTRVIYPAMEREIMVKIDNRGNKPVLAQSWVDDGNPDASPETANAPFTITPPINRINAGKGQTLRLMYTGEPLPTDKESVFWLNVLEVPPLSKDKQNQLQMAFRSRIKIFFRPAGLAGNANKAGQSVTWKKVNGGVEGTNPTPYYVSLANIAEDKEGKRTVSKGGMIAPGGKTVFAMKKSLSTIYPSYINDFGGINPTLQPVAP